jgi:hypothetical protein
VKRREPIRGYDQVFQGGGELQSLPDGFGNWALPFPIPYRSIGYFVAALAAMFALRHVWVLNLTVAWIKGPIAYTIVPGLVSYGLTKLEPHGRPATRHLWALLRHRITPKSRVCGGRALRPIGEVAVIDGVTALAGDLSMTELPHCLATGPGVAEFRDPVRFKTRGHRGWVCPAAGDGPTVREVELDAGGELVVQP